MKSPDWLVQSDQKEQQGAAVTAGENYLGVRFAHGALPIVRLGGEALSLPPCGLKAAGGKGLFERALESLPQDRDGTSAKTRGFQSGRGTGSSGGARVGLPVGAREAHAS